MSAAPHRTAPSASTARNLPAFYREFCARFGEPGRASRRRDSRREQAQPSKSTASFPWREQVKKWLRGPDARAGAASLLFHFALLICLSLMVVGRAAGKHPTGWLVTPSGHEDLRAGLDSIFDNEITASGGIVEVELPAAGAAALANSGASFANPDPIRPEVAMETALSGIDSQLFSLENPGDLLKEVGTGGGGGTGQGHGRSTGNLTDGFSMPGGGRAVRKGKFTAWTVPSDPRPRQAYLIVIQVEWPKTTDKKVLRARRNDLIGTVIGSDTYFQAIEETGQFVPKSNQMVIPVPGAEANVQDVIRVRSKMLNEGQELTITF